MKDANWPFGYSAVMQTTSATHWLHLRKSIRNELDIGTLTLYIREFTSHALNLILAVDVTNASAACRESTKDHWLYWYSTLRYLVAAWVSCGKRDIALRIVFLAAVSSSSNRTHITKFAGPRSFAILLLLNVMEREEASCVDEQSSNAAHRFPECSSCYFAKRAYIISICFYEISA